MALIKCPECGIEVSDRAENCPKCAYPIAGGGSTETHSGRIQTIELTSKRYKLQEMLSGLLIIGSIIVMIAGVGGNSLGFVWFGLLCFLVGVIWAIIVRFKIWWHHE